MTQPRTQLRTRDRRTPVSTRGVAAKFARSFPLADVASTLASSRSLEFGLAPHRALEPLAQLAPPSTPARRVSIAPHSQPASVSARLFAKPTRSVRAQAPFAFETRAKAASVRVRSIAIYARKRDARRCHFARPLTTPAAASSRIAGDLPAPVAAARAAAPPMTADVALPADETAPARRLPVYSGAGPVVIRTATAPATTASQVLRKSPWAHRSMEFV